MNQEQHHSTPAMPELSRGEIIDLISPQSKNSADHDIEFAHRVIAALQSAQPAATVSDADLYGTLEPTIVSRYIVEKRVGGGFWGYCVKAGDGAQEIFVGHKNACEHVRQALQTACLDGAYMAHEKARAILALRPQAVPMTDEQVDRIWNALPMGNGFWLSFARAVEAHHGITQRPAAQAGCNHVLYETADADRPKEICDRNGEVVLAMCKLCSKAEAELETPQPAAQATPEPEGFVSAQAEFNQAIDFAIKEGIGAAVFLDAWRHGDTSEWPEFAAMSAQAGEGKL